MNIAVITHDALEGYLNCKYLAHLRLGGHQETKSEYEEALLQARLEQELAATNKLRILYDQQIIATGIKLTRDKLREGASFILDAELHDDFFQVRFDGLKKVEGHSDLGAFHYVPMLLSGAPKVHKRDRVLLETLGLLVGRMQGRMPNRGVMYHGPACIATSVPFSVGLGAGKDVLRELARMQQGTFVPKLLLNDHCRICEFSKQCHAQAVKDDNPKLKSHTRLGRDGRESGTGPPECAITHCMPSRYEIRLFTCLVRRMCRRAPPRFTWIWKASRMGNLST